MAQIILRTFVLASVVSSMSAAAAAAPRAQSGAVQQETTAAADETIRGLRAMIAADPHRSDAWVQIADIEAARGNIAGCLDALHQAVLASPGNPSLYSRLSQAYASAGYGKAALQAIDGALALQPNHTEYIRARAMLSTWVGDYGRAREDYRRLQALHPTDLETVLALARVSAWAGDTDRAVKEYKRYLRTRGADAAVWMELAKAESWRGNFAAAIDALETFKAGGGNTDQYLAQTAAVYANAGRPRRAEDLVSGLLSEAPRDYDLNLTRAIALAGQQRAKAAFESLDTLRQVSPDRPETRTAEHVLRTLLASSAESPLTTYADSDDLTVQKFAPRAVVALSSGAWLSAGFERSRLDARTGSGLDRLDGRTDANYEHLWTGVAQRLGGITLSGQVGYATTGPRVGTTYGVGIDARLADTVRFALARASAPFVVSPRTLDLGLTAVSHRAQMTWTPTLRYQVVADASFQELSDGNRRWEMTLSPRRTVARQARFNLDLGATIYRLQTSRDFDHGYYDPRRYEMYAATIYPYLKIGENVGLGITAALGMQRDNTSRPFHFGGNIASEATFGIYRPWVVKLNGSATLNGRLDSGAFRGFGGGAALIRRF